MNVSPDVLRRLAQFDTPTICNVIELFDERPRNQGYMDHRVACSFPNLPVMVGFAATASFRSDAPPPEGASYDGMLDQLGQFERIDGPPVIVFQDLDDPPVAAVFGEVMCSMYKAFGAAGLVTNGAGRDLDQVRRIEFPVFTGATICSHAYCHIFHVGLPVRVGGLTVRQGDLLHGDANGVTSVPVRLADQIAACADDFVKAEAIMLDYLNSPGPKSKPEFVRCRESFAQEVARIKKRLH